MFYGNELVKDRSQIVYIDLTKSSLMDYEEFEEHLFQNYQDYLSWFEFFVKTECFNEWTAPSGYAMYEIWYMGNCLGLAERRWGSDAGPGYDEVGIYWF